MTTSTEWQPDILGPDFRCLELPLGTDPDGEGEIQVTLVRYYPGDQEPKEDFYTRPAIVWVHGMSDYFFQTHVAQHFHQAGYAFYALDLRKCGRSRQEGQSWHYASDFELYFDDLNVTMDQVCGPHGSMTLIAHSTAGAITPLWLNNLRVTAPQSHKKIDSLILNSPWLDIMGVPTAALRVLKPAVRLFSRVSPFTAFPGGGLTAYAESLHVADKGEWDFDTTLKPKHGHRKYLGWLNAVLRAQREIHKGNIDIGVPCLALCSHRSQLGQPYNSESNTVDLIIDVKHVHQWAPNIGKEVTIYPILGARHDVFLSLERPRQEAFSITQEWLDTLTDHKN